MTLCRVVYHAPVQHVVWCVPNTVTVSDKSGPSKSGTLHQRASTYHHLMSSPDHHLTRAVHIQPYRHREEGEGRTQRGG